MQDFDKTAEELRAEAKAIKVGCTTILVGAGVLTAIAYWIFG